MGEHSQLSKIATMLIFTVPVSMAGTSDALVPLSPAQILQKMEENAKTAQRAVAYTEVRRYALRNDRFKRQAEMNVRVVHRAAASDFEVLQVVGSEDVYRRVFKKVLEGEAELSRLPAAESGLTHANYEVELLGTETIQSRRCYVLQLLPRRKSKYLLQGRAWIDVAAYSLVRLEGRPTASLSLLVGKPLIVRSFMQVTGTWVAAHSQTTSSTRLLGTTELTIEHRDHLVLDTPNIADTRAVRFNSPLQH